MKTTNNIQKTTLRSAAVIASFILISLTVSAQDFWRDLITNNSFGEIAEVMVYASMYNNGVVVELDATSKAWFDEYVEEVNEENLEIENWMIDASFSDASIFYEEAQENSLEIESWMMKQQDQENTEILFSELSEPELKLEAWMIK
ncbi:MAG: hypothetical protein HQ541_10510 [Mariniphaga sp.]|nr:hypothetical protein [Mariniphaga sp.]